MYQFTTKDLQVAAQFFQLLVKEFLEVGCFGNFVADLDVHAKASPDEFLSARSYSPHLSRILLLLIQKQAENDELLVRGIPGEKQQFFGKHGLTAGRWIGLPDSVLLALMGRGQQLVDVRVGAQLGQ